jgi:hypothetical protein
VQASIPNIGISGQQQRRRFGVVMLVVAAAASVAMIALGIDGLWRWAVFLPFSLGATGVLQARERT